MKRKVVQVCLAQPARHVRLFSSASEISLECIGALSMGMDMGKSGLNEGFNSIIELCPGIWTSHGPHLCTL